MGLNIKNSAVERLAAAALNGDDFARTDIARS